MAVSDGVAQQVPAVPQMAKQIDLNKATDAQLKTLPGLGSDGGQEDQDGEAVQAGRGPEEGRAGARFRAGQEPRHGGALTHLA